MEEGESGSLREKNDLPVSSRGNRESNINQGKKSLGPQK